MWGWEEPQRDGCALDSTRTVCREHTRSGHTATRSTSTDCTTLRDLNTSSHVTHVAAAWGSGPGCRLLRPPSHAAGVCGVHAGASGGTTRVAGRSEHGARGGDGAEARRGWGGRRSRGPAPCARAPSFPCEHRAPPAWDAHLAAGLLALSPHGHGQASQLRGRQALPRQSRRGWEGREGPVRCRHGAAVSPPAARPLTRHAWHRRPSEGGH